MISTILIVYVFGIQSIYVNSMLASPTYVDGELVSVDFWTNFFFNHAKSPLHSDYCNRAKVALHCDYHDSFRAVGSDLLYPVTEEKS